MTTQTKTSNALQIKDYLHLYWGCEVFLDQLNSTAIVCTGLFENLDDKLFDINQVKLILRPISDMTDAEKDELDNGFEFEKKYGHDSLDLKLELRAEQIKYLLSRHLDIFNLIPAGLALDSTKMMIEEQNPK
jgi:hypothetical protein